MQFGRYSLAILALLTLPVAAKAAPISELRSISVSGNAEILVVPDEVTIGMSINLRNPDMEKGRSELANKMAKVLAIIKKQGVKDEHLQTDYISIQPRYFSASDCDPVASTFSDCEKRINEATINYYEFTQGVTVSLKDVSKFETIMRESLTSGITNINSTNFTTSKLREHRDKARDMASKAAKEKADAVAGALGQKVGKPITISVEDNHWSHYGANLARQNVMAMDGGSEGGDVGATAIGQIKIDATVTVSFELQ